MLIKKRKECKEEGKHENTRNTTKKLKNIRNIRGFINIQELYEHFKAGILQFFYKILLHKTVQSQYA